MFSTTILQLIIFFLPTQLGLHFWPGFSRVAGIKIDYLSPTLYFTDILIILYLLPNIRSIYSWQKKHYLPIAIFLGFVSLNTIFAISPLNTLFWWLRNLVYLLLFLTFRLRKVTWSQIKTPLLNSTILVISVEIIQLLSQSSLGGIFYWLGERNFSASTPGLARLSFFSRDIVRAPSIFSHPNSLAGYLLIIYYLFQTKKSPLWQKILVFIGLLLSFSKGTLLAFLLVITVQLSNVALIFTFLIISIFQVLLPNLPNTLQFISDRLFLLAPVKDMLFRKPLLGTGLGGFIPSLTAYLPGSYLLPGKLQPVHNLPLLMITETGLYGLFLVIWFLRQNLQKISKKEVLGLISLIVITGTFDHYWWTLPQNKLILLLAFTVLL